MAAPSVRKSQNRLPININLGDFLSLDLGLLEGKTFTAQVPEAALN